ncbi:MAG: LptF/LptG family permease, partial [Bacteroidaceae bacterium]
MLRIKKLDRYVLKNFLLLFSATFFICLFIFMMQFLWRYVDQLVGKGLGVEVLLQFFFYSALTLIPVSLPLAVLLASLITFGNFGERFELLAMKAAGISLIKIMRPLIVLIAFLCLTSFFFQNIITPEAQTKLYTLIISMKQKSPELDIPEGVFYNEIKGYNLYVKEKDRKTGLLRHITIYNFSNGFENAQIVVADSGRLEMAEDKQHLFLRLYSGELFENLKAQNMSSENVPYRRESFQEKHSIIQFDADFNMVDESIMSGQSNSKNMQKLELSIDSMRTVADSIGNVYFEEAISTSYQKLTGLSKNDSTAIQKANIKEFDVDSILKVSTLSKRQAVLNKALNKSETIGGDWEFKSYTASRNDENIRRHQIAWHEKFTLSLACLIFFFIGAPLGAIIRKGGLGMPVVISVLIFIVYYIINNTGYKMARDGNWIIWMGMWTSTAILAPIGFFLTYKSNN